MTFRQLIRMPRFMLDHRWSQAHMSDEIDRELGPEDRSRLMRHVENCEKCHRMLDSLRQTVSVMKSAAARSRPGFTERVLQNLDRDTTSQDADRGPPT